MTGVSFQALMTASGAAAAVSALTQVLSSTSVAATITLPASILGGDLITLVDFATSGSTPTLVTPSGYANLTNVSDSLRRVAVCYKISDGTDSSAVLTGMDGTSLDRKAALVFRPTGTITLVTGAGALLETNLSAPANQAQNVGASATPVVVIGMYHATGTIPSHGMSPAQDGEVTVVTNQCFVGWKIYNASPANETVSMGDGGTNTLSSMNFIAS